MPGIAHAQINPKVVEAEYAVRGAITQRAAEIEKELASGKGSYEFDKVLYCNIGNPQSLNQKPISYPRQLLACCEYPEVRFGATSRSTASRAPLDPDLHTPTEQLSWMVTAVVKLRASL